MAKRLIWTEDAQNDRKEIFGYFNNRNKSKKYSQKLNLLFLKELKEYRKIMNWEYKRTSKMYEQF